MNDLLGLSDLQLTTTSISEFIVGFLITIFLSILVKLIYESYSNSVSNKKIISHIFPIFSISIFLIVITIKSSIVLSLGLVGALSIIRFRTAIKEAEQIVYFLILTAISIATAASSYIFPFLLVLFLYVYNYYYVKKQSNTIYSINDQIVINVNEISANKITELVKSLNELDVNVEIQSINKKESSCSMVLKVSDFEIDYINNIEEFFKRKKIQKNEIQFFSSSE